MKRLHPISGVGRILNRAVRLGSFGLFAGFVLTGPLGLLPFEAMFVLVPLGALLGAAYGTAWYYRFTYELADGTLAVNSGVFDRQERAIPLGRIQNVDIQRGPVQRLFGLAVVRFETAGGSSTEAVLNAISDDEARALQAAVTDARRGDDDDDADDVTTADEHPTGEPGDGSERAVDEQAGPESVTERTARTTDAGDETDRQRLYELSTADLLVLALVSFRPAAPAVILFSVPFAQGYAIDVLSRSVAALGGPARVSLALLPTYSTGELALIVGVAAAEFALAAWILSVAFTLTEYYGFTLEYVGDDLRYQRGLIQEYSGSIPLEKVQTVTVTENVLMRQFGFAALAVETAGYAPGSGSQDASNTAIPLDDRATVVAFAEALTDSTEPEFEGLPNRSRRRYAVRYSLVPLALTAALGAVDAFVVAVPYWYAALLLVPVAVAYGHLKWTHRGFALLDRLFVARSGVLVQSTRYVPYYRVQTVIDSRTVFQRRRSLASVTADTASTASLLGGNATAYDIDDGRAREVHETLRTRLMADLRARARGDRSHALDEYVRSRRTDGPAGETPVAPSENEPSGSDDCTDDERSADG